MERICKGCGRSLPLTREYFGQTPSGGFRHFCRPCKNKKTAKWAAGNPEKTRAKWERQNARRAVAGKPDYDSKVIQELKLFLKNRCAYCNSLLTGSYEVDHVIPLNRGGLNTVSNITLCCRPCNREKGDRTADEYFWWRMTRGLKCRVYFGQTLLDRPYVASKD